MDQQQPATPRPYGRYSPATIRVMADLFGRYLSTRQTPVSQTGFGGERDYYSVLGYPLAPTFEDYEDAFRRQDIARQIIVAKPNDTWKEAPKISFTVGAKTSKTAQQTFLTEWNALCKRVRLWDKLRHADVRAGLGRYSVVVMGFRARGGWETPIGKKKTASDLIYLAVYDEPEAQVVSLVADPEDPRFNLPEYYSIDTGNGSIANPVTKTHWSRVIHVAEDTEDDVYAAPRLEIAYNLLQVMLKTVHGAAEAIWHDMVGTFHADVREGYELTPEDEDELTDTIDEFIHGLRRVIRTEGIDLTKLEGKVIDPTGIFEVAIQLVCAATQIPRTIMVGSDRGDVSKTEETRRWSNVITGRRRVFAEPLLRSLMERLVECGTLPPANIDEVEFTWSPLIELSDLEKAQLAEARGRAVSAVSLNSSADVYIQPDEFRQWVGLEAMPDEFDQKNVGLRTILSKIVQNLTLSGATLYAAAVTAGFSEEEAKALASWSSPFQPPVPPVPAQPPAQPSETAQKGATPEEGQTQ